MSENQEKRTIAPHFIIIGVIVVVILAVIFWPDSDKKSEEKPDKVSEQVKQKPLEPVEPEPFEGTPEPEPVEIDPNAEVESMPDEVEPEPLPADASDEGVKTALNNASEDDKVNQLVINEGLLQRFVVSVTNLANDEMAPNHQLLKAPEQSFRVYSQAGKEWIDAASYKRYTPYVDMLESFENDALISMFQQYRPQIQAKYAEIGDPDTPFQTVMINAIDKLLDTPEVPVPVEVYTDSVAYKFADPQLENLNEPQKQLLRTGPDNMRRIKAKLREIKALLEEDGSQ